jgi:RimJ/RimL family protein N-acetyltransferase
MITNSIYVKILTPDDWEAYRDLWLEALQEEQWAFSVSYEQKKASFTEEKWRASCQVPHHTQSFMLMDGDYPAGLAGVKISKSDPTGKTIVLLRNYIRKDYRGRGLSDYFYRLSFRWGMDEGFSKAEAIYRQNNIPAQKAGQKWGFVYDHTVTGKIFNGEPDDVIYYKLQLSDLAERLAQLDQQQPIPLLTSQ